MNECQNIFMNDNEERIIVSCGQKGSYKTTGMIGYIALKWNEYDVFFLVLPAYDVAKNGNENQYNFLVPWQNTNKLYIFDEYHEKVSDMVFQFKKNYPDSRVFFGVDDATADKDAMRNDPKFTRIITVSRHMKIKLWLCIHNLRSVLNPTTRNNIDYIFLHYTTNEELLRDVYDMYAKIDMDYKEFKNKYLHAPNKTIFICCCSKYNMNREGCNTLKDFDVSKWEIFIKGREQNKKLPMPKEILKKKVSPPKNVVNIPKKSFLDDILEF